MLTRYSPKTEIVHVENKNIMKEKKRIPILFKYIYKKVPYSRIIVSSIFKIKIVSKICFAITECLISHMLIGSFVS